MPPLPEDGPVLHNEPLDAGSDDEVASLATAHTPEADEGDTEVQGKQKRAREEEDTADSEEKEGNETESTKAPLNVPPIRSLPPRVPKKSRPSMGMLAPDHLCDLTGE
jgi:hypothetical protein